MEQDLRSPEAILLGGVFQGRKVLIQPQTTKHMSGGSLGLFVWLSGWLRPAYLAPAGAQRRSAPQKALLCVSFHVALLPSPPPQWEVETAHYLFILESAALGV